VHDYVAKSAADFFTDFAGLKMRRRVSAVPQSI
jgi:hypothetical protein